MRRAALCFTISMTLAGCTTGGTHGVTAAIDDLMRDYEGDVPGASVLVVVDGEPVVRRAYGLANVEAGERTTPRTNYRLASVSKQFTAGAILLLAEEGRLSLEDPARRWLPSLHPAAGAVTIRHLLTHTSGLVDYEDVIAEGTTEQLRDADVLRLLESEDRTYFAPGSEYRYSNSGYALLALIVEKVSGESFPAFLRRRIFEPLDMRGSLAHVEGVTAVPDRAFGYSEIDGRWVRTDQSVTSAILGDGGVYSSIDDLAKWDAALYDERLFRRATLEEAFTPATETDEKDVQYGFGWRISGDSLWHSGETIGFRNVILRYPQERVTVIVLTNRDEPAPRPLALEIARQFIR